MQPKATDGTTSAADQTIQLRLALHDMELQRYSNRAAKLNWMLEGAHLAALDGYRSSDLSHWNSESIGEEKEVAKTDCDDAANVAAVGCDSRGRAPRPLKAWGTAVIFVPVKPQ